MDAEALYTLAEALLHAEWPAASFSHPIRLLAQNRESYEEADGLTLLCLRSALRNAAAWRRGAFVEQLDRAQAPFWIAVRDAIEELVEVLPEPRPAEHFVGGLSFATPGPSRQTA